MSYHIISYHIISYHTVSCYIILYYIILYYSILYYIMNILIYTNIHSTPQHAYQYFSGHTVSLHVYIQANLLCVLFSGINVMGRSIVVYSTFSVLSIRISEPT